MSTTTLRSPETCALQEVVRRSEDVVDDQAVDARGEQDVTLGRRGAPCDDLEAGRMCDRDGLGDRALAQERRLLAQAEGFDLWRDDLQAEVDRGGNRLAQREAPPGQQAKRQRGRALAHD